MKSGLCCREDSVTASVKLDDLMAAFSPEDEPSNYRPSSAISLAWLSDTAVAVVLKQEHAGGVSRKLVIFSCTGYATTLPIDDEPCHVSAEIDGVVVLGHQTWSLVRDVPVAVQRVCSSFAIISKCSCYLASVYFVALFCTS